MIIDINIHDYKSLIDWGLQFIKCIAYIMVARSWLKIAYSIVKNTLFGTVFHVMGRNYETEAVKLGVDTLPILLIEQILIRYEQVDMLCNNRMNESNFAGLEQLFKDYKAWDYRERVLQLYNRSKHLPDEDTPALFFKRSRFRIITSMITDNYARFRDDFTEEGLLK